VTGSGERVAMLVTGATGKIGSRFVSRLLDAGDAVRPVYPSLLAAQASGAL
jgi:nucleoside-diphosphate-sugar epimerase